MAHEDAIAYGKLFPEFWVHTVPFDGQGRNRQRCALCFLCSFGKNGERVLGGGAMNDGTDDGPPGPRPLFGVPYLFALFVTPKVTKLRPRFGMS